MVTAYLLMQTREKTMKGKEGDQRSNVSLSPSPAAFVPRCCHLHCTAPAPVGISACRQEPAAGNQQLSLTLRQKQLKKIIIKKSAEAMTFFPVPSQKAHLAEPRALEGISRAAGTSEAPGRTAGVCKPPTVLRTLSPPLQGLPSHRGFPPLHPAPAAASTKGAPREQGSLNAVH